MTVVTWEMFGQMESRSFSTFGAAWDFAIALPTRAVVT